MQIDAFTCILTVYVDLGKRTWQVHAIWYEKHKRTVHLEFEKHLWD